MATVAIGVGLLAAPDVLGLSGAARHSHIIVGPIAATFGVIAMSASTRLVVRANVGLGMTLVVAPLLIDHGGWWVESVAAGIGLVALALIPRAEGHRFAGGWSSLLGGPARHRQGPDAIGQGG